MLITALSTLIVKCYQKFNLNIVATKYIKAIVLHKKYFYFWEYKLNNIRNISIGLLLFYTQ